MRTNIRYILLTAFRDRLFVGLLIGMLCAAGISAGLGGTAFLEEREMTITYTAGSARLMLMVGMIVFVCFHVRSAFDNKEIDVILSRPISRANLVIAYWLGFSLVAVLLALSVVLLVALLGVTQWEGALGWATSLMLEALLVVALALFSSLTQKSAVTSVLACMGFYVVSRMMAFFVLTAESGLVAGKFYEPLKYALVAISSVVPRLDFFAKTQWLIYGFDAPQEWQVFIVQALVFVPLLLAASIIDFRKKQF